MFNATNVKTAKGILLESTEKSSNELSLLFLIKGMSHLSKFHRRLIKHVCTSFVNQIFNIFPAS